MLLHEKPDWRRRPKGVECPICGRQSWCTISADGRSVRCTRAHSDKPAPSKNGEMAWIHNLDANHSIEITPIVSKPRFTERNRRSMISRCQRSITGLHVSRDIAWQTKLGVSIESLECLLVGYGEDWDGRPYTSWPSRNGHFELCGITRRYENGEKKTIKGTRPGLFYATPKRKLVSNPILIVEGGSDVAAAYTIGCLAIGRPSNTGGAEMIRSMSLTSRMIVVGERDEQADKRGKHSWCPSDCSGCAHCYPGLFGAKVTASQLGCSYIMPPEGCKDLRMFLQNARSVNSWNSWQGSSSVTAEAAEQVVESIDPTKQPTEEQLLEYAETDRQREAIKALFKHGMNRTLARQELG